MEITAESLRERFASMKTEALANLYHAGGMTDLAVSVLEDIITSRGLDWTEFKTRLPTEPESLSAWELWKSESRQVVTGETKDKSEHEAIAIEEKVEPKTTNESKDKPQRESVESENHAAPNYIRIVSLVSIIGGLAVALMTGSIWAWGVFGGGMTLFYSSED